VTAPLPPGWRWGTLGDVVASITAGVSVKGEDRPCREGEVGALKITSVLNGVFEPEHHKVVVPADRRRVAAPVTGGTVLVSRSNTADLVGASAYVPRSIAHLFLPDKLWQLRPARDINARWLGYLVSGGAIRIRVTASASGTSGSMKNISQAVFLALPIAIPPRAEQDAIVAVLRTWDEGIAAADEAARAVTRAEHSLVAGLLAPGLRGGWRRTTLGQVAAVNPSTNVGGISGTVAFYGMADLSEGGEFRPQPERRELAAVRTGFTRFQRGDVLVAKITPCFENGKAGWLREAPTRLCFGSTEFHVLRPNEGVRGEIVAAIVRHPLFRREGESTMSGSAGQKRVPADFLDAFPVLLPPLREMETLADALAAASVRSNYLRAFADRLRDQKRGLMSRLLSGSLRVPPSLLPAHAEPEVAHA
jgi:type I restriction enzyme, S subunit